MVNIFQIVPYYIPVGIIHILFMTWWYLYCKNGIIQTKLLDLKTKSPVFENLGSIINGISQISTYKQTQNSCNKMKQLLNNSSKANNGFWFTSRTFGSCLSYVSCLFSIIGIFIGIKYI